MDWLDYREMLGIGFCDIEKFNYFKRNVLSFMNSVASKEDSIGLDYAEYYRFCITTGTPFNSQYCELYHYRERLDECISVIKKAPSLEELLAYLIAFVNSIETDRGLGGGWVRRDYYRVFSSLLEKAHIQFELLEDNGYFFVFPRGAAKMDASLISQPLHWLTSYPSTLKACIKALKGYADADSDNASEVADKFRKALEAFFQEFFGGNKSLENYKTDYGSFLKDHGVPKEISGNLETLLQAYTNYINNFAKHRDATSDKLLEYLMYQTGNIIRLLCTLSR